LVIFMMSQVGKGYLRTYYGRDTNVVDMFPVDIAVNVILSVVWYTATHQPEGTLVYNVSSSCRNPINFKQLSKQKILSNVYTVKQHNFVQSNFAKVRKSNFNFVGVSNLYVYNKDI